MTTAASLSDPVDPAASAGLRIRGSAVAPWVLALASVLPTVAVVRRLLSDTRRGLDFTDEGMYLLSADARSAESSFHNAFGRYTQVLYRLAGHDVARFRVLGVVLLVVAAAALGDRIAVLAGRLRGHAVGGPVRIASGAALVSACLHYYVLMLLTPSYNWLNLVGIVLMMAAVAHLIDRPVPSLARASVADLLWIGVMVVGGAVATMGKLSSGPLVAGLGVALLAALARGSRRDRLRMLGLFAGFTGLFLTAHWVVINPLPVTVDQIRRGNTALLTLDPAYGIGNALRSVRDAAELIVRGLLGHVGAAAALVALASAISLLSTRLSSGSSFIPRRAYTMAPGLLTSAALVVLAKRLHDRGDWQGAGSGYSVLAWVGVSLSALALLIGPVAWCRARSASGRRGTIVLAAMVLYAMVGACSYAFGSGNGFFNQLNGGIGPLVAGVALVLVVTEPARLGLPVAVLALVMGIGARSVVIDAERFPYRQGPLAGQTQAVEIGRAGGELMVSPDTARFIHEIRSGAADAGWEPGTPLLDLSAYAATVLYILDARPPVTIIPSVGGYSTQQELAEWSVEQIVDAGDAEEWSGAWLLTLDQPAEGGIDPAVLSPLGRTFPADYELVGSFDLAVRGERLSLWRPATSGAVS